MRIFICLLHASAANTCARAANACIFSLYPFDHVFAAAAFDYNLGLDFILYCIGVVVCSRRRVIEFSGAISLLAHFSFFSLLPSSTAVENFGIKGHFCDKVSPLNAVKWCWKQYLLYLERRNDLWSFHLSSRKKILVSRLGICHTLSRGFPLMKLNIPLSVSNPPQ